MEPVEHEFSYPVSMAYLDLDELRTVFARRMFWSVGRMNLAWFRREDYLGDPEIPLAAAARDLVEAELGTRPTGPVRLLTNLRRLGHNFNPVSFYYCFSPDGETIEATIAEVTNTPWGETHRYVVPGAGRATVDKAMHVSPLMGMDQSYELNLGDPGPSLTVGIASRAQGRPMFAATLALERRELTRAQMARALVRYPAPTAAPHGAHLSAGAAPATEGSAMASASERVARALLGRLRNGHLIVFDPATDVERSYGHADSDLRATITIRRPGFHRALLRGSNGLAESYADGIWECDDVVMLIRMAARNMRSIDRVRRVIHPVTSLVQRIKGLRSAPDPPAQPPPDRGALRPGQRPLRALPRRVAHLFGRDLRVARGHARGGPAVKASRHLPEARAGPGRPPGRDRIGLGRAGDARRRRVRVPRVTTTTISQEQFRVVQERAAAAGLQDRVTVLLSDYRDLEGRYDKLVSVEMIEAVGWQYFDTFFAKCSDLLRPGGSMLLQAITIEDERLRGREGLQELHQHPHLPRRLPAFAGGHRAAHAPRRVTWWRWAART